jgi:glycosyltransferase involved in cell wall biosynthesis
MLRPSSVSADKARVLIVSPEAPYPAVGGGALRTASLVEYFGRKANLDVVVFREPEGRDPRSAFPGGLVQQVAVIDLPSHSSRVPARALRNAGRLIRGVPPLVDRFSGFEQQLCSALEGTYYDLCIIEHLWAANYVHTLRRNCRKLVLDLHNIESTLLNRCRDAATNVTGIALGRFATYTREFEKQLLPAFDAVLVASVKDAHELPPGVRWIVYPNTIPLAPSPTVQKRLEIVFSGNLGYLPNLQAVEFFRRDVWPKLAALDPALVWRIVGKNEQLLATRLRGERRIELTGPVEDALPELARASVAVVPLLSGSGTRVKILEAWAAGTAVVSTQIGAEGLTCIDGEHLLLAPPNAEFAASVIRVLQSISLREALEAAGRSLYETSYTWNSAWKQLANAEIL